MLDEAIRFRPSVERTTSADREKPTTPRTNGNGFRLLVAVCAAVWLVLATGAILSVSHHLGWRLTEQFDPDGELNLYAGASVLALALAATAMFLVPRVGLAKGWRGRLSATSTLGAFLALMAVDEFVSIHERLESASGVDWQILYAPIVVFAAVVAFFVIRRVGRDVASVVLFAGGVSWFVTQIFEKLQWHGDLKDKYYVWYMVPEELLELGGSLVLLIAAVQISASIKRRSPAGQSAVAFPARPRRGSTN